MSKTSNLDSILKKLGAPAPPQYTWPPQNQQWGKDWVALAQTFKTKRLAMGLSQRALAGKVRTSAMAISRVERGYTQNIVVYIRVAEELGLKLDLVPR